MEKLRYGVIGINGIGKHHIRLAQTHPHVTITALADVNQDAVDQAAAAYGALAFTDYRKLLAANVVDAVSVAVPHHLLAPIGLACLQTGIHLFIEKPFAVLVSQADTLVAEAAARSLKLGVAFQYRTFATPRRLKQLVEDGTIGTLRQILWTWHAFRPQSYYAHSPWRRTWAMGGGGLLLNQVSHDLDLLRWLAGEPRQINAMIGCQLHDTEVEDIASATIQFANGALATFQSSINRPASHSVRQLVGDQGILVMPDVKSLSHNENDQILLGIYAHPLSSAVAELPGGHDQPTITWQRLDIRPNGSRWRRRVGGWRIYQQARQMLRPLFDQERASTRRPTSGHGLLLHDFVDAILYDRTPMITGEDAAGTVELVNGLVMAAMTGQTVRLPLDRGAVDTLYDRLSHSAKRNDMDDAATLLQLK